MTLAPQMTQISLVAAAVCALLVWCICAITREQPEGAAPSASSQRLVLLFAVLAVGAFLIATLTGGYALWLT